MRINDSVRKCVAFLGAKKADGTMVLFGTAFLISRAIETPAGQPELTGINLGVLVTARHLVDGIRKKLGADSIYIRLNKKDGTSEWIPTNVNDWLCYEDGGVPIDLAMMPGIKIAEEWDHMYLADEMISTPAKLNQFDIGLGEEVMIVGLFTHHDGHMRNTPIVRIGNIAAINEENVNTGFGPRKAHLIEARSIGGLSGSPVFLNLGAVRNIKGKLQTVTTGTPSCQLFGLIHGHFDEKMPPADGEQTTGLTIERVNTGIAIVTPVEYLVKAIDEYLADKYPHLTPVKL